ncbi:MAG TPA: dihydrodipicolinate synthase family protein [Burkholderiales bacterium]|nr:dihydrodipicolinate synthase family protein [Burkholderiales bacterium]
MNAPEKLTVRIKLPSLAGNLEEFRLSAPRDFGTAGRRAFNRVALAAAHVVADPLARGNPWLDAAVDWDATLAYRRYLWSLGLGVAEAMDTAQRGMGLDWKSSLELIRRSIEVSGDIEGAVLFSGAGTDQLAPCSGVTLDEVVAAYEEQCGAIERLGGRIVLMASRALAACARSSDDYQWVYRRVLSQTRRPVIIHWLGEMFDPQLTGYWGEENHGRAMNVALAVIEANRAKVDGIKISLLDRQKEIEMRRRLPQGVRMYTGDDFNYPDLIEGDRAGHSDALLGIFDAIAPAASAALDRLASGDTPGFHDFLAPTVPLARHIFAAPTRFYKTGLVFLAWLNGHQEHFVMVGGQQSARSVLDLAEIFRLADAAGLLRDPELAASRMRHLLAVNSVDG